MGKKSMRRKAQRCYSRSVSAHVLTTNQLVSSHRWVSLNLGSHVRSTRAKTLLSRQSSLISLEKKFLLYNATIRPILMQRPTRKPFRESGIRLWRWLPRICGTSITIIFSRNSICLCSKFFIVLSWRLTYRQPRHTRSLGFLGCFAFHLSDNSPIILPL